MSISENQHDPALILLVDDSEDMRTQVKHYLTPDGYSFLEASDGKEALSLLEKDKPDLVMMDLAMPIMDGIETCTRIRLLPEGELIPVLMVTAMDDRDSIENAFRAGANEYINKPVHWSVLQHRIKSLLDAGRGQARLEALEALQTLNRVIEACTSTLKLDEILGTVLDEAIEIAGLEGGTICLLGADETLHLVAQRGASEETIEDLTSHEIKVGQCLCGNCAKDMKPLILWNREEVLTYSPREAQRGEDIRFHASFAFVHKEKCVGVLCVFSRTDRKPDEKSLKLLETISGQVGLAIENARLYEETVQNAGTLKTKIEERTRDLEAANMKLRELDHLKSMFIASMSHELRTPLNSIIGFTGITLQNLSGELNPEQRDNLERVYKSGKHLSELITDIIDISKIEAGRIDTFPEEFALDEMVEEAIAAFQPQLQEKGLTLKKELPAVTMRTDRKRLLQCLLNFLSNAVKYSMAGAVTVKAKEVNGNVDLSVSDTGIGIAEQDVPRLFEAFERIDTNLRVKSGGTGLGLYLTRKIVTELLHGSISVQSDPGKGSIFTVRIPKDLEQVQQSEKQHVKVN